MNEIILFGCGETGKAALEHYGKDKVYCFCDNNVSEFEGKPVITVESLKDIWTEYKIVLCLRNQKYIKEVSAQLQKMGIEYTLYDNDRQLKGDNKDIFTQIYKNSMWGADAQTGSPFFSGSGSHERAIIDPYIRLVTSIIDNNEIDSVFEIGCGDFNVMRGIMDSSTRKWKYTGMDVVEELIEYNQKTYGNEFTCFEYGDACADDTVCPHADLLIIRQVLQHLDNASIKKILANIPKYRYSVITEHISIDKERRFNIDKPIGDQIRLLGNSGVFIEKEPFNIRNVVHLLSIHSLGGVIRTSLVINERTFE